MALKVHTPSNYFVSKDAPKYKVVKVMRISGRKQVLRKNLTRDEAVRVVNSYPSSNRSMVIFTKQ